MDIDNLAENILGFDESAPVLTNTKRRIIDCATSGEIGKAQAAANAYLEHAEELVQTHQEKQKAMIGAWVKLAKIWEEAGQKSKSVMALNRAINYCQRHRWPSIATAIRNERNKLQNANV